MSLAMQLCACGRKFYSPGYASCARCRGESIHLSSGPQDAPEGQKSAFVSNACKHRGKAVGKLECLCGYAYQCRILPVLCTPRKLIDEWVHAVIDGERVRMHGDGYRCCDTCDQRA